MYQIKIILRGARMLNLFTSSKNYKSISPQDAKKRFESDKNVLLIDVRTPEEFHSVRISNSISVPLNNIKDNIAKVAPNKDTEIIVHCQSGARASTACNELVKMGYTNISNMGGIMSWPFEKIKG
jgi:phage shock protein E